MKEGTTHWLDKVEHAARCHHVIPADCTGRIRLQEEEVVLPDTGRGAQHQKLCVAVVADANWVQYPALTAVDCYSLVKQFDGAMEPPALVDASCVYQPKMCQGARLELSVIGGIDSLLWQCGGYCGGHACVRHSHGVAPGAVVEKECQQNNILTTRQQH